MQRRRLAQARFDRVRPICRLWTVSWVKSLRVRVKSFFCVCRVGIGFWLGGVGGFWLIGIDLSVSTYWVFVSYADAGGVPPAPPKAGESASPAVTHWR